MTLTSKAAWKRRRLRILDRDGWRCVLCGAASRLEVDHRVPLQDGGLEEDENLRALCRSCHIEKAQKAALSCTAGLGSSPCRFFLTGRVRPSALIAV